MCSTVLFSSVHISPPPPVDVLMSKEASEQTFLILFRIWVDILGMLHVSDTKVSVGGLSILRSGELLKMRYIFCVFSFLMSLSSGSFGLVVFFLLVLHIHTYT
jgi:hypothetical protein